MSSIRLAKATLAVLIGLVASHTLVFGVYVVAARSLGSAGYGALSVALALLALLAMVSSLGLRDALPREIAYVRARGGNVDSVIVTALFVAIVTSIFVASLVELFSPRLSLLLGVSAYPWLLRAAAIALPFIVTVDILVAVARAHGRIVEKVLIRDIMVNSVWLLGAVASALLGWGLFGFVASYVASLALGAALIALMLCRAGVLRVRARIGIGVAVSLLAFSLPLLVSGALNMVMTYTDTLMLGALRGASEVGLYNAAAPLARIIPLVLGAAGYLVLPFFSELYARGETELLKLFYVAVARWVFVATYPLAAALLAAPRLVVSMLFGTSYLPAARVLPVLALGFFTHVVAGPNGITLVVLRRSKLIMLVTATSSAANVVLNLLLIPRIGLIGAAAATALSYVLANVLTSYLLYRIIGLNPFGREYLAPLLVGAAFLPLIAAASRIPLLAVAALVLGTLAVAASVAATPLEVEHDLLRVVEGTPLGGVLRFILRLARGPRHH